MNVNTTPTALAQGPTSVCSGSALTVTTNVTGGGSNFATWTYLWEYSSNNGATWNSIPNIPASYSGANTANLRITSNTSMDSYRYRVWVSNGCLPVGSAYSSEYILDVRVAPTISGNPVNTTVCEQTSANFSITAYGAA